MLLRHYKYHHVVTEFQNGKGKIQKRGQKKDKRMAPAWQD
jgi:hypothetical protein